MFALLLIKFNSLAIRTRLLAGLSVGLFLLLLGALVGYQIFSSDDLIRFTSKNTQAYLHLDNRNAPENFYKIKITDALLESFRLGDLDRHLIDSEIAVLCDAYNNESACGLIIQAKRPESANKFLTDRQISFRRFGRNIFVISQRKNWLAAIKKSFNPFRYRKYQGAIGKYGALTAVFNQPLVLTGDLPKIFKLSELEKPFKFHGSLTSRGITIKQAGWKNILPFGRAKPEKESLTCDLLINTQSGSVSKTLNAYIWRLFAGETELIDFLGQPSYTCLNKTRSTGDMIDDYDITVRFKQRLSADNIPKLEKILLNLAAYSQPAIKSFYLADGTRISELRFRPDRFSFDSANDSGSIKLNESQSIVYSNTENGLIISNKIGLNMPNTGDLPKNFISIRINSLPDGKIKDLLSGFSYLIAADSQLVIK